MNDRLTPNAKASPAPQFNVHEELREGASGACHCYAATGTQHPPAMLLLRSPRPFRKFAMHAPRSERIMGHGSAKERLSAAGAAPAYHVNARREEADRPDENDCRLPIY